MAKNMRAKMTLNSIVPDGGGDSGMEPQETLHFNAVTTTDSFNEDGSGDEDNTFARWTPSASLEMCVMNPDLLGTFKVGDTFYVDFTPVPDANEPE